MKSVKVTFHPKKDAVLIEELQPFVDDGYPLASVIKDWLKELIVTRRVLAGSAQVSNLTPMSNQFDTSLTPEDDGDDLGFDLDALNAELDALGGS